MREIICCSVGFPEGKNPWGRRCSMKTRLPLAGMIGLFIIAAFLIPGVTAASAATGNGAMSGPHYNLNLISIKNIDQLPTNDETNNGNRIFVNTDGRSKIYLQQNTDGIFNVIDYIATRNDPAKFTLPAPANVYDAAGNYVGPGAYKVFVRVVGKPGGSGQLSTCGESINQTTGLTETICSVDVVTLAKSSKFSDVTRQLTTVQYDVNGDGVIATNERVDIFDAAFQDYLWAFDNNGLKNVQLRFYPI
jgi:hypothetical protein